MTGVLKILGCVLVTTLGLVLFTQYEGGASITRVLGIPVVAVAQKDALGIVAVGQVGARGVIVLAQVGFGVVTVAQGGVGLIFGVGQLMVGLVAVAQLGLGLFFFLGQVGFGATALGQLAGIGRGAAFLREMSAEVNDTLRCRGSG